MPETKNNTNTKPLTRLLNITHLLLSSQEEILCILLTVWYNIVVTEKALLNDLSQLIKQSQQQLVVHAICMLTMLFELIGKRINQAILQNKHADYDKQIVVTLSQQLTEKYGRNFEEKNLRKMLQFAEQFTDKENVVTLSRHLSWSHLLVLIPLKKTEAKERM